MELPGDPNGKARGTAGVVMVMADLTDPKIRDFLLTGTRTGKVGWVAKSGHPYVTPIWFVLDGESIVFNTGEDTAKAKAMKAEPRVSFVVDLEEPPYGFVKVDGHVQFSDDLDEVRRWATEIGGRYMGADRAEEFGQRNGVPGELLVRIRPHRVTAAFELSD